MNKTSPYTLEEINKALIHILGKDMVMSLQQGHVLLLKQIQLAGEKCFTTFLITGSGPEIIRNMLIHVNNGGYLP